MSNVINNIEDIQATGELADAIAKYVPGKQRKVNHPTYTRSKKSPESIIRNCTRDYVEAHKHDYTLYDLADRTCDEADYRHDELMDSIYQEFELENATRKASNQDKFKAPTSLPPRSAADLINGTGDVRVLKTGSKGYLLAVKKYYRNASTNWATKWAGWWEIIDPNDETNIVYQAFRLLCPSARPVDKKAFDMCLLDTDFSTATQDPHLVWFRNGVWNYKDRSFTEYDDPDFDEKYPTEICLGTLPVYHPLGKAPQGQVAEIDANGHVIEPVLTKYGDHKPWKPTDQITEPFDMDTEVGKACSLLLLQSMQFLIRKTNSEHGYYQFWINGGGQGHNGKGTTWDMMNRLITKDYRVGDEDLGDMSNRIISASVDEFEDDKVQRALARNIMTAYAITGTETNASSTSYVADGKTFKILCRGEEMTFRDLYQSSFSYAYNGFLLQQCNRVPRFQEKNNSITSHLFVLPFENKFGEDRGYIKRYYVKDPVVASYWAYRLTVEMDMLTEYDADALKVLEPYKRDILKASMNTFDFFDDVLSGIQLTVIPSEFLYSLYKGYCAKRGITGKAVVSFSSFRQDMEQYGLNNDNGVYYTKDRKRTDKDEVTMFCPVMHDYGEVYPAPKSEFMHVGRGYSFNGNDYDADYFLNVKAFRDPSGTGNRQFYNGCFVRNYSWKAMNYQTQYSELIDSYNQQAKATAEQQQIMHEASIKATEALEEGIQRAFGKQ
jgi:phage/plasmid-associated DNA primase